ncbi:MAG TPA: inositol monophosphatase family protein [Bacteroidia bacterium]|jgi:myo-inositol-1(or 4)-monophosphatase|nr:inositol monophosphatase family protein [Bacteroidia bacterium]
MQLQLNDICNKVTALTQGVGRFILNERDKFSLSDIEKKGFNDLVSYVDKNSEKALIEGLTRILPGSGILAEESGETEKKEYTWVIDPLDGTTNFLHKLPCFAISVALVKDNEPILGVVHELNLEECFSAIKGQGAKLNEQPIHVSICNKMEDSLIATGFPYNRFSKQNEYMEMFKHLMTCTQGLRRIGSASVDLCYVACGRFEAFYEYGLKPWDVAAGALIVKEAGGSLSDFKGDNDYIFGQTIVASNTHVHKEFMNITEKFFGGNQTKLFN